MAGWAVMAVVMAALWLVQRRTRNAAIVDVAWSFGTGILAAAFALATDGWFPRRILVAGLAGFWGLRLGSYLMARVRADGEEDVRYREFRRQYGGNIQPFLFGFFQLQAVWAVLFAIPMLFAARNPIPAFGLLDFVGILIWVVALSGEGLADRQLARFRNDPANRGAVCRTGLWRYSRHPNYFFEWVHWWAYVAIGIAGPLGWVTLFGPVVMFVFLMKITGIPLLEQRLLESRGDAYREYQKTTSPFFPWPPRRTA
jgi:steroid 5-alpha reductase family enzyme